MLDLLWLVPALPLAGFLLLVLIGARLSRPGIAVLGAGSVALSAVAASLVAISFVSEPPAGAAYSQTLWTWLNVAGFSPGIGLYLDALSLVMVLVVTVVGFLIHLYSAGFMREEEGYSRFFAYMNLFVGAMLVLLLADNLLLLYLGWEGVGLCSFLLIGFWYQDPANGRAARKAFIVTRVGDTALAIGLFLLFANLGTLHIQDLMGQASDRWIAGEPLAVAAAALLLGGAVGKSAQLPLQTWLPDAMAGPTPVSALIHAATMVTAGVYLIARTHVLFSLAPGILLLVAVIGAVTLLMAGFSALTQRDIKRVLAYSTISQIGYMFLALGVGAWSAAIFHFMTHAFFKALLFLGAGAVILTMQHEHDMFKMGGLRRQIPLTFWTFIIGAASLASVPLVTAGFYSKDLILWQVWSSDVPGVGLQLAGLVGVLLWLAGLFGAVLTALYTFRMVFVTFFGPPKGPINHRPGKLMQIPLVILAILSIFGGYVELPQTLGDYHYFSELMRTALPAADIAHLPLSTELLFQVIAALASLAGIYIAYFFFIQRPEYGEIVAERDGGAILHELWFQGWGFDWLYDQLFVRPYAWLAQANRRDFIDLIYRGIASLSRAAYGFLSETQTGRVRWYAMGITLGAVLAIAIVVFL